MWAQKAIEPAEALDGWREQRAQAKALAEVVEIPAKVRKDLEAAGVTLWTAATKRSMPRLLPPSGRP